MTITSSTVHCTNRASLDTILMEPFDNIEMTIGGSEVHCVVGATFGSISVAPFHERKILLRSK